MTVPFKFQEEDVDRITAFGGRCLIAHEMGLGKTFITLLWMMENRSVRPAIVVCPASIKWSWAREAAVHARLPAEVLEGRKPPARRRLSATAPLWIINYDILGPWLSFLKDLKPQLVIVDECQAVKSLRAARTKNVWKLCKGVPHILALSGTPLTNRPAELWSVLSLVKPKLFPTFRRYADKFCNPRMTPWGWDYSGATNLPKLHKTLKRKVMIRRRKVDVLDQLPPRGRHIVPLEMDKPQEYREAAGDFLGWLAREGGPAKAKKAARAQALVKAGYLKRLAARLKLRSVLGWVDDFLEGTDDKLVLFAVHTGIIKEIHDRHPKRSVVVTGEVTGRKRQAAFDQLNKDPKTRILIGNVQAAGVGWSASAASTVAFAELDWTPGLHAQAEDRVHGIGRGRAGRASSAYYLVAKDSVEMDLCGLLQEKMQTLNAVLDGGEVDGSLDVFDRLLEVLAKGGRR